VTDSSRTVNAPDGEPQVIVVADDDEDVRELIAFRLTRAGYRVAAGKDGEEALSLIQSERPDLAVLDIMMPKLNGYEVTRRVRSDPAVGRMPVLLLTASVQEGAATLGFEAGASEHMRKPFSPQELVARVRSLLGTG
jgi:two-component system response regulator MtrA